MSATRPETASPGEAGTPSSAGPIHDWAAQLARALGTPADVDVPLLLDVARDVAHAVNRPAVPVTMFLLGHAAARDGGTAESVRAACARTEALARDWAAGVGRPEAT